MIVCKECEQPRPLVDGDGVCGYCSYLDVRSLRLTQRLVVRVPAPLRARLMERVQEYGVPLSAVVRYLLEIGLEGEQEVEDAD